MKILPASAGITDKSHHAQFVDLKDLSLICFVIEVSPSLGTAGGEPLGAL